MTELLEGVPTFQDMDFSAFGEVEVKPLGRIQTLTAGFLHRNAVGIPHVTHHDLVDVTAFEERRRAWNSARPDAKATPVAAIVKALAANLAEHPRLNSSLSTSGREIILKKYCHVGVAIDTPNGLLVGVVRDCDRKTVHQLAQEIIALSEKARNKGLSIAEMSGGCISVSSLGHIGGTAFTPIINAPEVAILGVTRLQKHPTPGPNGELLWRDMLPMSLSYDHRVINGADAARFVVDLGHRLNEIDF